MRYSWKTIGIGGIAAIVLFAATPAHASRQALNTARAELMRIHVRLVRQAAVDPFVLESREAARRAFAAMYQVRQNALAGVHQSEDYADLRLALWAKQRHLEGLHTEIPVKVRLIMTGARDAMEIRSKIGTLEMAALEADAAYLEARDDARIKQSIYQQAVRDAQESIRTNAEFVAASARVRAMQQSITGYRGALARVH